jgi:TPR repeat protein
MRIAGIALLMAGAAAVMSATQEAELKDASGNTIIKYVVEAPANAPAAGRTDPAKQLGLFLCFPEHDRPVGDEILPVREALKRQGLLDQYVLVAGGPQERKFGPKDHEPIQKLLAWALKTYAINPRRVYMYGKGEGGKISGEFSMLYPNLTAGSISYSWGWWKMQPEIDKPLDAAKTMPEIYLVLGLRDLSHHLTNVRDAYARTYTKGYHIIYREFADLGARTYHQPSNDDAISWATRLRHKTMALSADESELLKAPRMSNGRFPALSLVGGAQAGAVLRKLLASQDAAVRAAAARTASDAIFDEETMAALGKAATDTAPVVRREALRALALHANWRSAAAQNALIELATAEGEAVDADDRVSALDGIIFAARLQVNGVKQDAALFSALVTMLNDKDERLRTMASNFLSQVRDPEFRGDLPRKENKEPEGGWTAWLQRTAAEAQQYFADYLACGSVKDAAAVKFCEGKAHSTRNPAEALRLTVEAAEAGYVPAQAMAGMLYAIGKGAEQDFAEARKWLQKASDGGHKLAPRQLAQVPGRRPPTPAATQTAKTGGQ